MKILLVLISPRTRPAIRLPEHSDKESGNWKSTVAALAAGSLAITIPPMIAARPTRATASLAGIFANIVSFLRIGMSSMYEPIGREAELVNCRSPSSYPGQQAKTLNYD